MFVEVKNATIGALEVSIVNAARILFVVEADDHQKAYFDRTNYIKVPKGTFRISPIINPIMNKS